MDRSLHIARHGDRPAVMLVVGVNGTGKTTTCGKLARALIGDGQTVLLGAADTFRAAAADQLQTWGRAGGRRGGPVRPGGRRPGQRRVRRGQRGHRQRGVDVVIVDTAGRLHTKTGLMDELGKIKRVIERHGTVDEVLLVLDATTGQNGLRQARVFAEVVDVTGIVLTKLDGTAKGGIVIAVQRELGVPVKLVGLGEGLDDLAPFEPGAVRRRDPRLTKPNPPAGERIAWNPTSGHQRGRQPDVFETLSDRLTQVFSALRGRGRLSAADIDATCREIRIALLEADVALPVVREFISHVRERASGAEVSEALNPAQQVIKIVNEELIAILGGEARRLRLRQGPADRDHAGRPAGLR